MVHENTPDILKTQQAIYFFSVLLCFIKCIFWMHHCERSPLPFCWQTALLAKGSLLLNYKIRYKLEDKLPFSHQRCSLWTYLWSSIQQMAELTATGWFLRCLFLFALPSHFWISFIFFISQNKFLPKDLFSYLNFLKRNVIIESLTKDTSEIKCSIYSSKKPESCLWKAIRTTA